MLIHRLVNLSLIAVTFVIKLSFVFASSLVLQVQGDLSEGGGLPSRILVLHTRNSKINTE